MLMVTLCKGLLGLRDPENGIGDEVDWMGVEKSVIRDGGP